MTPGLIRSPSTTDEITGREFYPSNTNCTWKIQAPSGQVVQLVYV